MTRTTAATKHARAPAGDIVSGGSMLRSRRQASLRIGPAHDALEAEADRVADAAMRGQYASQNAGLVSRPMLQRVCSCESSGEPCDDCAEHTLQRSATRRDAGGVAPALVDDVLSTSGKPLEVGVRGKMEGRFGRSFGDIRIHTDARAAESARQVGGLAYTVGRHIVFGAGQYAPDTHAGGKLLAHELTHTVQQSTSSPRVQRKTDEDIATLDAEARPEAFMEAGWEDVNEPGVVYKAGSEAEGGGANLRPAPLSKQVISWLPQNSRVHVLRHHPQQRWYAVAAMGKGAEFGYVADWLIARWPPDPEAEVIQVVPGMTPIDLAKQHYASKGFNVWAKDERYVVNALVWVNGQARHNFRGSPVIAKGGVKTPWLEVGPSLANPWWTTKLTAGGYMWLPGKDYLNAVYDEVYKHGGGTGSLTGDLWQGVKMLYHYAAYGLAFLGGVIDGFLTSLVDAVAGIATLVYDVLKSLINHTVFSDIKELAGKLGALKWADIKDAVGGWADKWAKKLDSDSPWTAGHAHGYLTGYVMAEAAMLLMSGGALAEAKALVWGSRFGKALEGTRAFQTLAKGVRVLQTAGGKVREVVAKTTAALNRTRAAPVLRGVAKVGRAIVWTARGLQKALNLPAEIVAYLSEKAIARLRRFAPAFFDKIEALSERAKLWLFGCHSPCKIDVDAMRATLEARSVEEIEAAAADGRRAQGETSMGIAIGEDLDAGRLHPAGKRFAGMAERPQHHVFPQELEKLGYWEKRGFAKGEIDNFTLDLTEWEHQAQHGGGNPWLGRTWKDEWNAAIVRRIEAKEAALGRTVRKSELLEIGAQMKVDRGIDLPYVRYRRRRRR